MPTEFITHRNGKLEVIKMQIMIANYHGNQSANVPVPYLTAAAKNNTYKTNMELRHVLMLLYYGFYDS